jgi:NADH-quinone oxidoreductase subunit N
MTPALLYGLLPDHLVLGAMVVLMVLELAHADARLARAVFVVAMLASLAVLLQQIGSGFSAEVIAGEIRVDRLALLGKGVLASCALVLGATLAGPRGFKFWLLLASSVLGGMLIMTSAGFVSFFLGIEMLSLPVFAMMVHGAGRSAATEGAFKYLVMSSAGTALLLFGISLAYGSTGTLSIAAFAPALASEGGQTLVAGLLVLCGLFLKAAVFPFHGWAPDAYAGARLGVVAVMASVVKAAAVLALLRVVAEAGLATPTIALVILLGLASIGFGNLAALGQRGLRRLLAYSSIAHAGYMIFALADSTGGRVDALLWYVGIYALTTLLACVSFAALCPGDADDLDGLDGKFAARPGAALLLAFAALSLAGVPPFPGFFAKLLVFKSVVESGHLVAAILAFVGSFLGLGYYLGVVVRLFRVDATAAGRNPAGTAQGTVAAGHHAATAGVPATEATGTTAGKVAA